MQHAEYDKLVLPKCIVVRLGNHDGKPEMMSRNLAEWLAESDLAEFEEIFTKSQVDLKTLEILTDSDLKELGLAFGPRKRILNAIANLKNLAPREAGANIPVITPSRGERRQLTVMFSDLVG